MSLGLNRVSSIVKLPDLARAIHSPKCLSREYLHMGFSLGFISGIDFIHVERKYTWKCPWTPAFPLHIGKPCKGVDYYVYVVMTIQS